MASLQTDSNSDIVTYAQIREGLEVSTNDAPPRITFEMRIVLPNGAVLRNYSYKNLPDIKQRIVNNAEEFINAILTAEGLTPITLICIDERNGPVE